MPEESMLAAVDLAKRLKGTLHGDPSRRICDVAPLEQAGPDALSWVAAPSHLSRAVESKAGVLLLPEQCAPLVDRTVIRVADPDAAMCEVLELLAPPPERVPPGVHPSATVAPSADVHGAAIGSCAFVGASASVGKGTQLHPGVYVGAHAAIGRDCVLWPNAVVRERVIIGDRVVIHPNATIGADGFSFILREGKHRKVPQIGTVTIEDDVEIGSNTSIDRARSGTTRIRRGTKIDNQVQIGHNCDIGEDCIIIALCGIGGSTTLGHHVVMAGQAGISDHQRVGNLVTVAGGAGVTTTIPDGQVVRGIPAIEGRRYLREQAAVRKLPEALKTLKALVHRVEELQEGRGESS